MLHSHQLFGLRCQVMGKRIYCLFEAAFENVFFSRGGGGGNLICLEGVEAKGKGYGEGGGGRIIIIIFFFLQGRGEGVNIIVWVRGGLTGRGEGGED